MQYSTVHIVGEMPYFCCSDDSYHCQFCPVLWSSFSFFNTGTSNKMKLLSSSVCSLFSFRISNNCCSWITLCKNFFCTFRVLTCSIRIYACCAICILFTLFVFITVFFLIADCHWSIFKMVAWTCVLGSRNNIWPEYINLNPFVQACPDFILFCKWSSHQKHCIVFLNLHWTSFLKVWKRCSSLPDQLYRVGLIRLLNS